MKTTGNKTITVEVTVSAPVDKVWTLWSAPQHITKWLFANDEWHTPHAENDFRPGGRFLSRMEAKDGSEGFDFTGTYDNIKPHRLIEYTISDGRKVTIHFNDENQETKIIETFEAEEIHPEDLQKEGWQSILENFRKYAENF